MSKSSGKVSHWYALGTALVLAVVAPGIYAQIRIGVVDMQRAIVTTRQGQQAKMRVESLSKSRQDEIDSRRQALEKMRADLEKSRGTLPRQQMAAQMQQYIQDYQELEVSYQQYQQEVGQLELSLTKGIISNMQGIIVRIGQQGSFTTIFEQAIVAWVPPHLDVTPLVVTQYDQQFPDLPAEDSGVSADGAVMTVGDAAVTTMLDAGVAPTPVPVRDAGPADVSLANPHPRGGPQM